MRRRYARAGRWKRRAREPWVCQSRGSSIQVLADEADEKYRHDIGEDDGKEGAGRSHAGIEVEQRLFEDQECDVGTGIARASAGGRVDFGENAHEENHLDHDHDRDRASEVWNVQIAQLLEVACAVHAYGFQLL